MNRGRAPVLTALEERVRRYGARVNVARVIVGDGYRVTFPELETIAYWEGDDGYLFHGGWGVTPPVLAVPPELAWDEVTPDWLRGKRQVVLARLRDIGNVLRAGDLEDWQYRKDHQSRRLTSTA